MSYRDRDRRSFEPPLPKPYEFVPLGQRRTSSPAGHARLGLLHGCLHASLLACAPVHVGSGLLEHGNDRRFPLYKAHFRTNGRLAIPATSLKGCIRSILEAISPSAITITRARPLPNLAQPSRDLNELDPAQRLFGTLGYQGQVRFSDALIDPPDTIAVIEATPQLFRPRSESAHTYYDGSQPKGRKFYMHGQRAQGDLPLEACPINSRFTFQVDFQSLSEAELGLLLLALGLGEPKLWPKLGGGKPACLGTVEVQNPQLELWQAANLYSAYENQPATIADIAPYLTAAQSSGLVLADQLRQLAAVLRWPHDDRDCPDRSY